MTSIKLAELRKKYSILVYIELLVPEAHELAYYPRLGCVAVSEFFFKVGMCLPLYHFYGTVLRSFVLAPNQVFPNGWSQLVEAYFLWKEVSLGKDMPLDRARQKNR